MYIKDAMVNTLYWYFKNKTAAQVAISQSL